MSLFLATGQSQSEVLGGGLRPFPSLLPSVEPGFNKEALVWNRLHSQPRRFRHCCLCEKHGFLSGTVSLFPLLSKGNPTKAWVNDANLCLQCPPLHTAGFGAYGWLSAECGRRIGPGSCKTGCQILNSAGSPGTFEIEKNKKMAPMQNVYFLENSCA